MIIPEYGNNLNTMKLFFLGGGHIRGSTQNSFLTLCTGDRSYGLLIKSGLPACKASVLPTVLSSPEITLMPNNKQMDYKSVT